MTHSVKCLLITLFALNLISCSRIKNKTIEITNNVKSRVEKEVKRQSSKVIDKIFPPFDHDKPDTENNKKRFRDFIKVDITPDITEIYCFDNAIGVDASYMFSFRCNPETSKKIIEEHSFKLDTTNSDNGFYIQHNFKWWDKERISELDKYSWTNRMRYYKYYWYDKLNNKAYFFDFDM
ncbi:MAG: hypothetical protein N4A72_10425 [Bacteroidales bacterium]|jgi:hypothetical protein|nr:hypothetical protein [Bacteroidales bacterium]